MYEMKSEGSGIATMKTASHYRWLSIINSKMCSDYNSILCRHTNFLVNLVHLDYLESQCLQRAKDGRKMPACGKLKGNYVWASELSFMLFCVFGISFPFPVVSSQSYIIVIEFFVLTFSNAPRLNAFVLQNTACHFFSRQASDGMSSGYQGSHGAPSDVGTGSGYKYSRGSKSVSIDRRVGMWLDYNLDFYPLNKILLDAVRLQS